MIRLLLVGFVITISIGYSQFRVSIPKNPFPSGADSLAISLWERNFLSNLTDTIVTLRLGQNFKLSWMGYDAIYQFDSVAYNGGGNNRKAIILATLKYHWDMRDWENHTWILNRWDTTRTFALPYLSTDSSFAVTTLYGTLDSTDFILSIGLEKIIGLNQLSIAKLHVSQREVSHEAISGSSGFSTLRLIRPGWGGVQTRMGSVYFNLLGDTEGVRNHQWGH